MDLIGPWTIKVNKVELEFKALTCIDLITNHVEIIWIRNKTSHHIAEKFANCWLSRYPRPMECVHDNGSKFIGHEFQDLLTHFGITHVKTTVKNPQSNAVCERGMIRSDLSCGHLQTQTTLQQQSRKRSRLWTTRFTVVFMPSDAPSIRQP